MSSVLWLIMTHWLDFYIWGKESLVCRIDLFPELDDCAEVCARLCYHDTTSPCFGFYIQTRQGKMKCHFRTRTDMYRSCKNCDLYSLPESLNRTESSLPGAQDFPSWLNDPTQGENSFPQDFQRYLESWDTNDNSAEWVNSRKICVASTHTSTNKNRNFTSVNPLVFAKIIFRETRSMDF